MPDGTCMSVDFPNVCAANGGNFQGYDTDCATACGQGGGACCIFDGTCVQTASAAICGELYGTYQGDGTDCATVACPQPGACCLADGTCVYPISEADCSFFLQGTFRGIGTTCVNGCIQPGTGACCLADGTCAQATRDDCLAMGGGAWSAGLPCAATECFAAPATCVVELDGDGTPGTVFDLLAFLDVWFPVSGGDPCP